MVLQNDGTLARWLGKFGKHGQLSMAWKADGAPDGVTFSEIVLQMWVGQARTGELLARTQARGQAPACAEPSSPKNLQKTIRQRSGHVRVQHA